MGLPTADDVLSFWFGPLDADGRAEKAAFMRWWQKSEAFDADIGGRFGVLQARLAGGADPFDASARGRLATVIVLDQFSRNLHRNSPDAFANDARAQAIARAGLETGLDRELRGHERGFFLMPLCHSEDLADHARLAAYYEAVKADEPAQWAVLEGMAKAAGQHREIVERFGRYPHRNGVLSRTPTPDEIHYLAEGGTTF